MARIYCLITLSLLAFCSSSPFGSLAFAQEVFDIFEFDETATGPWSDIDNTTVTAPLVPFRSIEIDGTPSSDEYGGFVGVTVTPGENAWLLPFPDDRAWDGPDDSSFTFWLAHDDAYLYLGVDVKDDVVNSDDPNEQFWRDDSIEIVTDVWNDNYDNNTDLTNDTYGGHGIFNFEGRFSSWDDENEQISTGPAGQRWSSAVDWTYGEEGDIFGFGEATETGWNMEVRFRKELFEDPEAGITLEEGTRLGFNIGLNDDDDTGGDTGDLDLQSYWSNRERFFGWDEDEDDGFFTSSEIATAFEQLGDGSLTGATALTSTWGVNQAGRLSHGGAGEILFGGFLEVEEPDTPVVEPPSAAVCDPSTGGDLDGNGRPEFGDFLIISTNFGTEVESHLGGDIDCDGTVGFSDFLVFSTNFGIAAGTLDDDPIPDPIPEDPIPNDPVEPGPATDPSVPVIVDPEPILCDPSTAGDVDGNGQVEFADFLTISTGFGQEVENHTQGDVDCDGVVGFGDFLELSFSFGSATGIEVGDPIEGAAVPEPNGSLLGLFAVLSTLLIRKRRKRSRA